jgi:hypothetical protein
MSVLIVTVINFIVKAIGAHAIKLNFIACLFLVGFSDYSNTYRCPGVIVK